MRLVILTTESKHHTYFIQRIAARHAIAGILYEERRFTPKYPTGPFLEKEEDRYEERFFDERHGGVSRVLDPAITGVIHRGYSINDAPVTQWFEALHPDVAVTFGVGRVRPSVIAIPRWGMINIHRGIVPEYRGLDSDLWAILEGRLDQIGVTVHYVDENLDTGEVIAQQRLTAPGDAEIHHFRYLTTVLATDLVLDVLPRLASARGRISGTIQPTEGRYFSAMPLERKQEALERFRAERQTLPRD